MNRTGIPQKPTPMPSRTNFSAGAYTPAAPVVTPAAEQPLFSTPIREEAAPAQAEPTAAEPAPIAPQEPVSRPASTESGRVSDDEFGLIMDILNRSRKK